MTSPAAGSPAPTGPLSTGPLSTGPLSHAELAQLESTLLPALERHHLRLLAHGLRSLQAIAGRRSGPIPTTQEIADWASRQPSISTDAAFQQLFTTQLSRLGTDLSQLAAQRRCEPLALDLSDLCAWAIEQADQRLER